MNYKHTLQIELTTQFPQDDSFVELIKKVLGPWCDKVTVVELNVNLEQATKEKR